MFLFSAFLRFFCSSIEAGGYDKRNEIETYSKKHTHTQRERERKREKVWSNKYPLPTKSKKE